MRTILSLAIVTAALAATGFAAGAQEEAPMPQGAAPAMRGEVMQGLEAGEAGPMMQRQMMEEAGAAGQRPMGRAMAGHGRRGHGKGQHPGMMGGGMMGGGGPGGMRMMMIMMDTDGDGALSLEEVQAVHERFFRAIDADGDERVTQEEIQGFMHGGDAGDDTE